MSRRAKVAAILFVAVAFIVGASAAGWWVYDQHQKSQALALIRSQVFLLVKNTTLRLQDSLSLFVNSGSMSYAEAFRKLDDHVLEIDKRLLELRTLETGNHPVLAEAATSYMKSSQDVIRKEAGVYRQSLEVSTKTKWFSNRANSLDSSSFYAINFSLKQLREAKDELHRALTEFGTTAAVFDVALDELLKVRESGVPQFERPIL